MSLVEQVKKSENTPLLTLLLSGNSGVGKTALSAFLAKQSDFPFVRRISAEDFVGFSEVAKISKIGKIFDDAYKSSLSLIVMDDLERLMDYVRIGPRFSNLVLQALFSLLKKQPPKHRRRLMVIATTSDYGFLEDCEITNVFNVVQQMGELMSPDHFRAVLQDLPGFSPAVVGEICSELSTRRLPVRSLLLVAEMAVQRSNPVTKQNFMDCMSTVGF